MCDGVIMLYFRPGLWLLGCVMAFVALVSVFLFAICF